jgi:hypothetical protein
MADYAALIRHALNDFKRFDQVSESSASNKAHWSAKRFIL